MKKYKSFKMLNKINNQTNLFVGKSYVGTMAGLI